MPSFAKLYKSIRDFIVTTTLAAYPTRASLPVLNNNTGVNEFWDFLNGTTATAFNNAVTGTGLVLTAFTTAPTYYPGSVELRTTAVGDTAKFISGSQLGFSTLSSSLTFQTRAFVTTLSTGGQALQVKFGFGSSLDFISPPGLEMTFVYDSSVSSNWLCQTRLSALSIVDVFDSAVPVTTDDTYFRVYITPSLVYYYINNILVRTLAADFTQASSLYFGATQTKSVGSGTSLKTTFDAVKLQQVFSSPRAFV